jgi:hypothetical protein
MVAAEVDDDEDDDRDHADHKVHHRPMGSPPSSFLR